MEGEKRKKKIFIFFFLLLMSISAGVYLFLNSSIGPRAKALENAFKEDTEVFKSGEIEEIEKVVYGKESTYGEFDNVQSELISLFYKNANFDFIDSDKEFICVEVTSRDMSKFKSDALEIFNGIESDDDFYKNLKNYYSNQSLSSKKINLSYDKNENGNYIIDYNNFDFKDAVYGGFLTSYKEFREEFINGLSNLNEGDDNEKNTN